MERYYVVDLYEGVDLVFTSNSYADAYDAAVMWEYDTDGECNINIFDTSRREDLTKLRLFGIIK